VLLSWFVSTIHRPVGSKAKLRGVFPPQGWYSTGESLPVPESIANTATLSWPRLEP
jgi:hypothetical protein